MWLHQDSRIDYHPRVTFMFLCRMMIDEACQVISCNSKMRHHIVAFEQAQYISKATMQLQRSHSMKLPFPVMLHLTHGAVTWSRIQTPDRIATHINFDLSPVSILKGEAITARHFNT